MGQVIRKRDRTIVCSMDVTKCTLNLLTWKLTWELIQVKSLINASGKDVRGNLHAQMSWHVTIVNTLVWGHSNALDVNVLSRALTIFPYTWRDMSMNWKNLPKSTCNMLFWDINWFFFWILFALMIKLFIF